MAQKVRVILTDDLDGGQAAETVSFALDGKSYEIDLSTKNANKLRKALQPYLGAARSAKRPAVRASARGRRTAQAASPVDAKAVRAWAQSHGIQVSLRGRVPADVVERFRQAGN